MFGSHILDKVMENIDSQGNGGSKRLYELPNVRFRVSVDNTVVRKPTEVEGKKAQVGKAFYIVECTILDVQPRANGRGAGATTEAQLNAAKALIGQKGSAMVTLENRKVRLLNAAGKVTDDASQVASVQVAVLDEDAKDDQINGRAMTSLLRFAFAAVRGAIHVKGEKDPDFVKAAVPNVLDGTLDIEKRRAALQELGAALTAAFTDPSNTALIGSEIIIETSQYEKKPKPGQPAYAADDPNRLGNGLDFHPLPSLVG